MDGAGSLQETIILQRQLDEREADRQVAFAIVLRVYNYYRVVVSFFFIILFYQFSDNNFVGTLEPTWFQVFAILYLCLNISFAFFCLIMGDRLRPGPTTAATIMILDIMTLSLFMVFSGGVVSGLGNFLILPVAFGGIMITSRLSSVIPAVAAISCFACEFYVSITSAQPDGGYFFQVALLGVAFFIVNIFFQYLIGKMKEKEQEVVSLETLNRMQQIAERLRMEMEDSAARFNVLLTSAGEGVLGLNMEGRIIFSNPRLLPRIKVFSSEILSWDSRLSRINNASDWRVFSLGLPLLLPYPL